MEKPIFSVIIPTYNRAELLKRALQSLVAQTCKDFEVIVCDDGSTDHTTEVVSEFRKDLNIKYVWEENWGGPARPRNNGIRAASSEWICFLDSDDWWYPNKLRVVYNYLDKADLIYHDLDIYKAGRKTFRKLKARKLKPPVFIDLMIKGNSIWTSSAVVKKRLLEQVHLFDEDRNLIALEDFDAWLKISRETEKFLYIDKFLGAYWRLDGNNITQATEIQYNRYVYLYEKYLPLLGERDRFQARTILYYHLGRIQQQRGLKNESKECFKISMMSKKLEIMVKSIVLLVFLSVAGVLTSSQKYS